MTLVVPRSAGVPNVFAAHLERHAGAALITAEGAVTYAELAERVAGTAASLGAQRRLVAVEASNTVGSVVAYLAALGGGHATLLLPPVQSDSGRRLLDGYHVDVAMTSASAWEPDARRPGTAHRLHPDLALLLSTSGSTGSSKLVRLSWENLQSNAEAIAAYLRLTPDDRAITTLPLHYCYGLSVLNSHLATGASVVLTDRSVVDPCFWPLFRELGATSFAGVPYTFELLDRIGFESLHLPTLRYVTQAGGRLSPELVRKYAALASRDGWELFVMYGQTEATARMAYLPPRLAATNPGAIGLPIRGGSFTIEPLEPDEGDATTGTATGELVYRGPNVMLGYAHGPEDLARGRDIHELRTGDLGRMSSTGLYEVVGRRSRFAKPYGVRVDLDDLERVLGEAGVEALCAASGDRLVIAVQGRHLATAARALISDRIGVPPSSLHLVVGDALPRLPSGKPDYEAVRQAALAERPDAADGGASGDLRALFARILGPDVSEEDSFVTAGGDSLSYVEISVGLESLLGALPRNWHTTPIRELAAAPRRRRALRRVETTLVVRAVAIALIVGTHAGLWYLPGGAHTLLAVAGLNFARFQLAAGSLLRSISRIAVPSMCWVGAVAAVSEKWQWPQALLVNGIAGAADAPWGYWFIEAIVHTLLVLGLLFAVPAVRRAERRAPFAFAGAITVAALGVRFDAIDLPALTHPLSRPHEVFWLFALGWLAARATTPGRRLLVTALVLAAVPGAFAQPQREMVVAAGLLLVLWVPTLPVPAPVVRWTAALAGASLAIYLTHWQVYPPVLEAFGPAAATAASLVAGVAGWAAVRAVTAGARVRVPRLQVPSLRRHSWQGV